MKRFSRRELLGLGAAAGMVAASGAGAGLPAAPSGLLRLGIAGGALGGFAPGGAGTPVLRVAGQGAVFDCLTEIGAEGVLTGELATAWESDLEAARWRVQLRPGVTFHDGTPFGSEDVVATFRALMAAGAAPGLAHIRPAGPLSVEFRLRSGNAGFPFDLADPRYIILPAGRYAQAAALGIGTGLYTPEAPAIPGHVRLRRVATHWRNGQAGWFERVEIIVLEDAEARRSALESGRVDAINGVLPHWVREWRRARRIALSEAPASEGPAIGPALRARPCGSVIAHNVRLVNGGRIGGPWEMDSGRIAERWWFAV